MFYELMEYELFYLIGASKESELEKIKNEVEKIVEENGGKFGEKTTLEKRRLSYEVKHETHGIYIARRFELEEGKMLKEITTKLNLLGGVLRFIISKASDLPELKSKEERMEDANKKESASKIRREEKEKKEEASLVKATKNKKKVEDKKEEKEDVEKVEKAKEKEDDIDKKLEEILNI